MDEVRFCGRQVRVILFTLVNCFSYFVNHGLFTGSTDAAIMLVNTGADLGSKDKDGLTGRLLFYLFFRIDFILFLPPLQHFILNKID